MAHSKMVRCKTKHERKKARRRASGFAQYNSAGAAGAVRGASSQSASGRRRDEDYQPGITSRNWWD